jgi:ankyrin repeat protein
MSALMDAVEMCDLESVKLLVAEGADVKERDGYGFTPLLWAASHDHILIGC